MHFVEIFVLFLLPIALILNWNMYGFSGNSKLVGSVVLIIFMLAYAELGVGDIPERSIIQFTHPLPKIIIGITLLLMPVWAFVNALSFFSIHVPDTDILTLVLFLFWDLTFICMTVKLLRRKLEERQSARAQ